MTKRVVIALVAILVGLNVAFRAVQLAYPSPSGPPASAYATSEDGLAAFAELLRRDGHAVAQAPAERLRRDRAGGPGRA